MKSELKMKEHITRDMTISDMVQKYPQAIEPLLALGVHCVGCQVSSWETIEEGFRSHGMSEEEIDAALQQLNNAVTAETSATDLTLTDKAAAKIKEMMIAQGKKGHALRISIVPGGCSGFKYGFAFEKNFPAEDRVVEQKGVKVVLDQDSWKILEGSLVDYVETLDGSGFKVANRNIKSGCGCGQSFTT